MPNLIAAEPPVDPVAALLRTIGPEDLSIDVTISTHVILRDSIDRARTGWTVNVLAYVFESDIDLESSGLPLARGGEALVIGHGDGEVYDRYAGDIWFAADDLEGDAETVIAAVEACGDRHPEHPLSAARRIVHFSHLRIEPRCRGRGLGHHIVKRLCQIVEQLGDAVVIHPAPMEGSDEYREHGRRALRRYWRRLAFSPIPGASHLLYHLTGGEYPEIRRQRRRLQEPR